MSIRAVRYADRQAGDLIVAHAPGMTTLPSGWTRIQDGVGDMVWHRVVGDEPSDLHFPSLVVFRDAAEAGDQP